jgi:signal transduction histidine kinase/DNA-binding NarL/FixJ family response regulator/Flp pilus assembly protein TadD
MTSDLINLLREADAMSRKSVSESEKLYERARTEAQRSKEPTHLAESLVGLGYCQIAKGDFTTAQTNLNDAIALYRQLNHVQGELQAIYTQGILYERMGNLESAEQNYQVALAQAESMRDRKAKAKVLNGLATLNGRKGNYPASLQCFQQSLSENQLVGDEIGVAQALMGLGIIYERLDDYANAADALYKSFLAFERLDSYDNAYRAISNLGILQTHMGKYSDAIESFELCIAKAKATNSLLAQATALNNIAEVFIKQGEIERARLTLEQSLNLQEQLEMPSLFADTLHNQSEVLLKLGEVNAAEEAYCKSLTISEQIDEKQNQIHGYFGLAKVKLQQQNLPEALRNTHRALQLAEAMNQKKWQAECYNLLSTLYQLQGKSDDALDAFRKFYTIERDLINLDAEKHLQNLTVRFQVTQAKQQAEIERLKNVELADALKRLEEANAFKTELLGIAAHDLKNPLQVISGFASLIQEVKTLDEAQRSASAIERASERMLKLIKELLETAAFDSGRLELNKIPVNLAELLHAVVEHNRPNAEKKSQTLELTIEENSIAELDVERMREVFENLISNAVKYSPVGKRIQVRLVRSSQEVVRIEVKDEGQGLTESDKEKLFGKFQRLSARPTGGESSTGLGLSIVKQLVELHGGKVWAESDGKGKGATFCVELPMVKSTAIRLPKKKSREVEANPAVLHRTRQSQVQTIRVAIIEDNLELLRELEARLKRDEKLKCVGAFESAEMALALIDEVDVVLMDIGLPGISGIEAIQEIKARFPNAKIVMLTVQEDDKHISRAIIAGAHGYLTKKSTIPKILEYVETVMHGGMTLSPDIARRVSDLYLKFAPKEESPTALTKRETQILKLISDGKSLKEVAQVLKTSVNTVRNQVAKIYDKLHSHSKSEAVSKALKSGLI